MKQKPIQLILAAVLIAGIGLVVFFMLSRDSKESTFTINGGQLEIQGSFGVNVPISEISGLESVDTMPSIVTKTNGSGLGSVYKGEFKLEGADKARLYVDGAKPPFITFKQGDTVFYINTGTAEATQALFDQLKGLVK